MLCVENDRHGRYMIMPERNASRRNLNGLICRKQFCDVISHFTRIQCCFRFVINCTEGFDKWHKKKDFYVHEDPLLSLNMANSFNCMHKNYQVTLNQWESKRGRSNVTTCFALPCSQSSSSTWMHIKELRCVLPIWTAGRSATRLDDFISVQSTQRPVYRRELPLQFALCNVFRVPLPYNPWSLPENIFYD